MSNDTGSQFLQRKNAKIFTEMLERFQNIAIQRAVRLLDYLKSCMNQGHQTLHFIRQNGVDLQDYCEE